MYNHLSKLSDWRQTNCSTTERMMEKDDGRFTLFWASRGSISAYCTSRKYTWVRISFTAGLNDLRNENSWGQSWSRGQCKFQCARHTWPPEPNACPQQPVANYDEPETTMSKHCMSTNPLSIMWVFSRPFHPSLAQFIMKWKEDGITIDDHRLREHVNC